MASAWSSFDNPETEQRGERQRAVTSRVSLWSALLGSRLQAGLGNACVEIINVAVAVRDDDFQLFHNVVG